MNDPPPRPTPVEGSIPNAVPVQIRYADEEELEKVREKVREAKGKLVAEYDGLVEAEVPRGEVERLVESGLAYTFPDGFPPVEELVPEVEETATLFSTWLPQVLESAQKEVLRSFSGQSRRIGLGRSEPTLRFLTTARIGRRPFIDGIDIEGLGDAARRLLPTARKLLPEDAYLIRLIGPIRPAWREELAPFGEIGDQEPPETFRMVLTPEQLVRVKQLPFVQAVKRYGLLDTLAPSMVRMIEDSTRNVLDPASPHQFDLTVHREKDLDKVVKLLDQVPGVKIADRGVASLRVETRIGSDLLASLAQLPLVRSLAPYVEPRLFLDEARRLLGVEAVNTPPVGNPPQERWTGDGEVVAIFDTGIDATHPDLAPALALPPESYEDGRAVDHYGHGTHVAGIIAGRGLASGGKIRGVAPGAKLFSVGIFSPQNKMRVPMDLGKLLQRAVDAGAKIINLSWGFKLHVDYDVYGQSMDQFVRDNPEVLVVVAAGNEGQAPGPEGRHLESTVGMPAGAKNVLTVGACGNTRNSYLNNWGQDKGPQFPLPPASLERVAGQPNFPAAISSRGPTLFNTIKPDLLAPGALILSAWASLATMPSILHPPPIPGYGYLHGTSMATPAVAGAAAVIRQYLRVERMTTSPSAALLKALLILGAVRLPNANQNSRLNAQTFPTLGFPDFDQGFGRLDLRAILPHPTAPADRRLEFADVANESLEALGARQPQGGIRKSSRTYLFTVPAGSTTPLHAVLAWTDPPGRFVQNSLSLRVTLPDSSWFFGNHEHRYFQDPLSIKSNLPRFDKYNNVLVIDVPQPLPGMHRLTILAESTSVPFQGYALAVGGPLVDQSWQQLP